jgi:CheY-like chemotaxis protein
MPKGGEIVVGATNESLSCPVPLGLAPGRYVRLWVADGGEGIRPEHLGKIYDPYFTTKRSGSGLGLAVCHSIVKRHRGAIDVRSERGKGTRFDVYLPASDRTPTAEKPTDSAQTEAGTGRILLMDDQASLRRVGALMLERLGFEADCAEDGTAAVAMYRKAMEEGRAYRAVLLDLTVPGGLGGRETLDRLLALDPHVKAIASSGYSGTLTLGECRAHGFAAVLPKPYTLAELGKAMAAVLPRQTAE